MGVKNLWDILESCKKTLPLHHLQNKRLCIDLSCWMVQLHNVNKSHCAMREKVYLRGLFHRLRALIALNCSLIFVTDGSIPAIKLSAYRRRLKSGTEVTEDETNSQKVSSLRRNMGSEFSCMIKEAKILGVALGIPCLDGIEEGEAQCALLNSESLCDGCFTSDSDVFLFGARTVYRDICLGDGGHVVCYEMDDIERNLGFGRNSLITLAVLLGGDYSHGIHGFGRESACQIVKSVGDSGILQRFAKEGLSFLKKPKVAGSKNTLLRDDEILQVINAYLKPKCHSADSDAVRRVLGLYPFQRTEFQEICARFFEWPPEKADEYILPKIAERDLRRFSYLRCTSSELGVHVPVDKIPVKCPITEIVKKRKVHGSDYFEVSWQEIYGLNTSVVPADLVERACPEKIMEFEEKRTRKKKPTHRKPRQKKPDQMNEIDRKLHGLMLDIERDSAKTTMYEDVGTKHAGLLEEEARTKHDGSLEEEARRENGDGSRYSKVSYVSETEVIDLSSPFPPIHAGFFSNRQESEVECLDIIVLSDSENEESPEHARKARELRSFLASIRDDMS